MDTDVMVMKSSLRKKITSGMIAGCFVLSVGGLAFAAPDDCCEPPPFPDKIHREHRPPMGDFVKHIEVKLTHLAAVNAITNDQKNDIVQFFKNKDSERQSEIKKIKDMTREERDEYFEQKHATHPNMIQELIDSAHLTAEQAQVVDDMLRPPAPPKHGGREMCPHD